MTTIPPPPDFRSPEFLLAHVKSIMDFYHPRCIDRLGGGFFQHFRDDGSIYDAGTRHLVSSTRFVINYARAAVRFASDEYREAARHGIEFLRSRHRQPITGGYAWILDGSGVVDATNHCYGLAFVLLAYAEAAKAGIAEAAAHLDEAWKLMERHFWSERDGLYCDEISGDWRTLSPYRGQNANMHACEAMLAGYGTTRDRKYLDRACTLARRITSELATTTGDLVWEHYGPGWQVDWEYNKDDPKNLFRPWGFQAGHQTEWAKLLLMAEGDRPEEWMLPRAEQLFVSALDAAWDDEYRGICYGLDRQREICDDDKYFWVQAESLAAAALLAQRTGKPDYWMWYERIWLYAWEHLIDHRYGAWYRILDRQNRTYDDLKSPAGKTDYHTMGACYDVLDALAASSS